jgi:hypothetical protein
MKRFLILVSLVALLSVGVVFSQQDTTAEPTLLLYSTLGRLLSGQVTDGATLGEVREAVAAFPESWAVVGIGTTNQPMRNGELMPEGTTHDIHFYWVDPSSEGQNQRVELVDASEATAEPEATEPAVTAYDFDGELPLVVLSVADPANAITLKAENVPNIHQWLTDTLTEQGIAVAGVQLTGEFGIVKSTVGYNLPPEGLDINSAYYLATDHFHPIDYNTPAVWTMNGIFATDPDVQPLVIAPNQNAHIHGYQPEAGIGGHIVSAEAVDVTVTVYPLDAVVQEMPEPAVEATAAP